MIATHKCWLIQGHFIPSLNKLCCWDTGISAKYGFGGSQEAELCSRQINTTEKMFSDSSMDKFSVSNLGSYRWLPQFF